jgi:hypothetical protein
MVVVLLLLLLLLLLQLLAAHIGPCQVALQLPLVCAAQGFQGRCQR